MTRPANTNIDYAQRCDQFRLLYLYLYGRWVDLGSPPEFEAVVDEAHEAWLYCQDQARNWEESQEVAA